MSAASTGHRALGGPELPEPHDQKLTVMLTTAEIEMLRELAEAEGVNMSDVVRKCIREKHARLTKRGRA
jgi:hypothetical protein